MDLPSPARLVAASGLERPVRERRRPPGATPPPAGGTTGRAARLLGSEDDRPAPPRSAPSPLRLLRLALLAAVCVALPRRAQAVASGAAGRHLRAGVAGIASTDEAAESAGEGDERQDPKAKAQEKSTPGAKETAAVATKKVSGPKKASVKVKAGVKVKIDKGVPATKAKKVGVAGSLPQDGEACVPQCRWQCEDRRCNQVCEPVCQAPRCETRCASPDYSSCQEDCDTPRCSVFCPPNSCATGRCASCRTSCSEPMCFLKCPGMQPCRNVCETPKCDWHCREPNECPAPICRMICEPPKECAHTTFHESLPPKFANETSVAAFRAPAVDPEKSVPSQITVRKTKDSPYYKAPVASKPTPTKVVVMNALPNDDAVETIRPAPRQDLLTTSMETTAQVRPRDEAEEVDAEEEELLPGEEMLQTVNVAAPQAVGVMA